MFSIIQSIIIFCIIATINICDLII